MKSPLSVVAVETAADLAKILNSSLLPLLTSIPAFLYIPVCFDALETARFTRCLLCSSPGPLSCLHTVLLIGKIFGKTQRITKYACVKMENLKKKHQRSEEIVLKGFLRSCYHRTLCGASNPVKLCYWVFFCTRYTLITAACPFPLIHSVPLGMYSNAS